MGPSASSRTFFQCRPSVSRLISAIAWLTPERLLRQRSGVELYALVLVVAHGAGMEGQEGVARSIRRDRLLGRGMAAYHGAVVLQDRLGDEVGHVVAHVLVGDGEVEQADGLLVLWLLLVQSLGDLRFGEFRQRLADAGDLVVRPGEKVDLLAGVELAEDRDRQPGAEAEGVDDTVAHSDTPVRALVVSR